MSLDFDLGFTNGATELLPGAEYGNLPFDRFAVVSNKTVHVSSELCAISLIQRHWDFSGPEQNDQEQWDELASKWLSMSFIERRVSVRLTSLWYYLLLGHFNDLWLI